VPVFEYLKKNLDIRQQRKQEQGDLEEEQITNFCPIVVSGPFLQAKIYIYMYR